MRPPGREGLVGIVGRADLGLRSAWPGTRAPASSREISPPSWSIAMIRFAGAAARSEPVSAASCAGDLMLRVPVTPVLVEQDDAAEAAVERAA